MNVGTIYQNLSVFLKSLIERQDWKKAILNIEIQPGMLGLNGYAVTESQDKISLKTRPTDEIREQIKLLHDHTATDYSSRWNKFRLELSPDMSYTCEFVWDEQWQAEIDLENEKEQHRNPGYNPPKWKWEEDRVQAEANDNAKAKDAMSAELIEEFEIAYLSPNHDGYPAWPGGQRWLCLYETAEGTHMAATRGLSDGNENRYELYLETTDEIGEFSSSWQGNLVYETARIVPQVPNFEERLQRNTYLCLQIHIDGAPPEWSLDDKNGNIGIFIGLQRENAAGFTTGSSLPLNIKLMSPQELSYSIDKDREGRIELATLYQKQGDTTLSSLDRISVI